MQFVIRKDQNTFSIDDQPDEQPDAKIVERWGGCLVVKVAGFKEYHGRGLRSYKPAEYQVWQMTKVEDCGETLEGEATFLIDFPVNPKNQAKEIDHHTSTA